MATTTLEITEVVQPVAINIIAAPAGPTGPQGPLGPTGPQGPAVTLPAWLAGITSLTITAGDELEIVKSGITYYTPLYRRP